MKKIDLIKKTANLIICGSVFLSCSEPTKVMRVGELDVTIPAKWAIGQQGDAAVLNVLTVIGEYCNIGINVSEIELNLDYIKYNKANTLPESIFKNLQCFEQMQGVFLGVESVETPFFATVAQQSVEGKVIVLNKYGRTITITYSYIKDSQKGKDDINTVLSSISFNPQKKLLCQTLDQRMENYVINLNKTFPVTDQEGITIDSAKIKGGQLIFSSSIGFAVELSPQEIDEASKETKKGILKHMVQVQNGLIYEWLNDGNDLWYQYFTNEKQLLMKIQVTVEDVDKMKNILASEL